MGCQSSKFVNPDILAIPPKIRPLLWKKLDDIRRRRSGARSGSTLSKKDLLTESGGHEETEALTRIKSVRENETETSFVDHDNDNNNDNNVSLSYSQIATTTTQENGTHDELKEEVEKIEEDIVIDDKSNGQNNGEENMEKEKEERDDEEKEDVERNICPGSPSFRVYYIESLEDQNKVHNEELGNNNAKDENVDEMQKEISRESVVLEDANLNNEDKETKIAKKSGTKNRMRIPRAIRRGPVAMKHLLNVSSCYHPSNERASLLTKKTDQAID